MLQLSSIVTFSKQVANGFYLEMKVYQSTPEQEVCNYGGGGGGANSKKVNTHPKIPEIDLDFFRLLLTFNKIVQILS